MPRYGVSEPVPGSVESLSPRRALLRRQMIEAATAFKQAEWTLDGYLIGTLVQPAHALEGGALLIPERHYDVYYSPGYGVTCQKLCTSNGSAAMIAACVNDNTWWVPAQYHRPHDDRQELEG